MNRAFPLQQRGIPASRLILGCMGLGGGWNRNPIAADHVKQAHAAVEAAIEAGIVMFDHADIYAYGKAETVFGQVLKEKPGLRDRILIQSKCGIRFPEGTDVPGRYDFSKKHILGSVDGILGRLGIESLDVLLLHRPDPLMEAEEVAEALHELKRTGKVKHFGVSNMSAAQIRYLQSAAEEPFLINQLELSLSRLDWLDSGVLLNQKSGTEVSFQEGTIEYCRMENIQIQAWGPLARGIYSGSAPQNPTEAQLSTARLVQELSGRKNVAPEALVLAWLMRHPAGIQPVVGTTNPERIKACGAAVQVALTREEWYSLYVSARGRPMP